MWKAFDGEYIEGRTNFLEMFLKEKYSTELDIDELSEIAVSVAENRRSATPLRFFTPSPTWRRRGRPYRH